MIDYNDQSSRKNALKRVNIGCGPTPTLGWCNYDNSFSVRLARYPLLVRILETLGFLVESQKKLINQAINSNIMWADATKHIPLPDNSVEVIYTSHMVEHLDREAAKHFMCEAHRVLAPNGIIRIAVPDLRKFVNQYVTEGDADLLVERTRLVRQKPRTALERLRYLVVGDRHHQWMYDGPSMVRLLSDTGYKGPHILEPGSTSIPSPGELKLDERAEESVYVEAYKPPTQPYRLVVVMCAPEPYHTRLLQVLGQHPSIDLTVYYESDRTIVGARNPDFGVPVSLNRSVLSGYRAEFLHSYKEGLSTLESLMAYLRIIPKLRRGKYDAVFIHSYATSLSLFAYVGAWISRIPVFQHTVSELLRPRRWWVVFLKKLYLSVLFRGTTAFLVIGTANREFYTYYGVEGSKMFHTPYSVDNDFFGKQAAQLLPRRAELKQALDFEADLPIIVFSAKLIPRKRPMDLLEAYRRLVAGGLRVGLLFIGEGELRQEIESVIQSHQLSDVRISGFKTQAELPSFYACGDIFVLPSQFDPWGVVVNEAMLFEMPAIVTNMVGSGKDLVEPDVTGYVYQVGDIPRLTELLTTLLQQPDKRAQMGKSAKQRVTDWNENAAADGVLQALDSVKSS